MKARNGGGDKLSVEFRVRRRAQFCRAALGATFILLVAWLSLLQPHGQDAWLHIKTGELIVETHSIPRTDPFSYVLNGRPWVTFEWLSQIVFYTCERLSPAWGLVGLRVLLSVSALLAFWLLAGSGPWATVLLSLAALTHNSYFATRPQLFDYVFLGMFLLALDRRTGRPGRLWLWLPAGSALWANLHGGAAIIGSAMVGLRAAAEVLRPRTDSTRQRTSEAGEWAALAVLCLVAITANAHGLKLFSHTRETLLFPGREILRGEWEPLRWSLNWDTSFLALGMAAALFSWRFDLHLIFICVAFGSMGVGAVRHLFLFVLPCSALLARCMQRRYPLPLEVRPSVATLACVGLLVAGFRWHGLESTAVQSDKTYPEYAVRFLDAHGVKGRIFQPFDAGPWFIWRCFPQRKVFVDSRNVEYGPAFFRQALDWKNPPIFEQLDKTWDFDYAVIDNDEETQNAIFDHSPRWGLVFWDDYSLLYLKRGKGYDELIRRHTYEVLQPRQSLSSLKPFIQTPTSAARALLEIDRAISESPHNLNARLMRVFVLGELGRVPEVMAELQQAIALFPESPDLFMMLGYWQERLGRLRDARDAYDNGRLAALRAGDQDSEALIDNSLGAVEWKLGNGTRAAELFRRCLRLMPNHPNAANNLARLNAAPK